VFTISSGASHSTSKTRSTFSSVSSRLAQQRILRRPVSVRRLLTLCALHVVVNHGAEDLLGLLTAACMTLQEANALNLSRATLLW